MNLIVKTNLGSFSALKTLAPYAIVCPEMISVIFCSSNGAGTELLMHMCSQPVYNLKNLDHYYFGIERFCLYYNEHTSGLYDVYIQHHNVVYHTEVPGRDFTRIMRFYSADLIIDLFN